MTKANGKTIAWFGVIVMFATNRIIAYVFDYWLAILMFGLAITMIGSVIWVLSKKRHWLFSLFGLLAPLGFIGIGVLKDKNEGEHTGVYKQ